MSSSLAETMRIARLEMVNEVVVARLTGHVTLDSFKTALDDIVEALEGESPTAILLDLREISGEMSFIDRYEIAVHGAEKLARLTRGKPLTVCISEEFAHPSKMATLTASNRGLQLQRALDIQEALKMVGLDIPASSLELE